MGLLLTVGSLVALSVLAADPASTSGASSQSVLSIPVQLAEHSVLAQFGGEVDTDGKAEESESESGEFTDATPQSSSRQGPGQNLDLFISDEPTPGAIAWQRPQEDGSNEPAWLVGGRTAMEGMEKNRASMSQQIEFDFNAMPLVQVVQWLSEQTDIEFDLNAEEIELGGIASVDSPITITGKGSVRELIRRSLDRLELTYVIHESNVEITTKDNANAKPNLRYYDLSYVLPTSANAQALVLAIRESVQPDDWQNGDATIALVGSMMIVRADDPTHQGIEIMLHQVAQMNPANVTQGSPARFYPSMGGMGGGMGGGTGGGGMF